MGCSNTTVLDNEKEKTLLSPVHLGPYTLKNRVVMAAMTRMRTDPKNGIPNDLLVKYYTERAEDAGFVLTECTAVQPNGEGFPGNAQLFNEDQMKGWKKVVSSVHNVGGKIFIQLYHCGRATNESKINGGKVVGASNVQNRDDGMGVPKELSKDEIKEIVKAFGQSAELAKQAGFDGVQLHGANGYLVDQFLKDCTNIRKDEYGGSIENRSRFCLEVIDELIKVMGKLRVGIKLSPLGRYNDMFDSNPSDLLKHLLTELNKRKIAFVEIARGGAEEGRYGVKPLDQIKDIIGDAKALLTDVLLIGNDNYTSEEADKEIKENRVNMVSFGKNYIANPDLVARIKNNWKIESPDWNTVFGGNEKGYCDYPKHQSK